MEITVLSLPPYMEEGKVQWSFHLSIVREDDVDKISKVGSEKGPEERAGRIKLAII